MNKYYYKIGTSDGRIISDIANADSIEILQQKLKSQGHFILELRKSNQFKEFINQINIFSFSISKNNLMLLCKEFSILIKAGLPIISCLEILAVRISFWLIFWSIKKFWPIRLLGLRLCC